MIKQRSWIKKHAMHAKIIMIRRDGMLLPHLQPLPPHPHTAYFLLAQPTLNFLLKTGFGAAFSVHAVEKQLICCTYLICVQHCITIQKRLSKTSISEIEPASFAHCVCALRIFFLCSYVGLKLTDRQNGYSITVWFELHVPIIHFLFYSFCCKQPV